MENTAMAMMNCALDSNLNVQSGSITNAGNFTLNGVATAGGSTGSALITNAIYQGSAWGYWQGYYYPQVIRESYPVYVQERSLDKGKQAFEIVKILKDKKLVQLAKVSDFVDLMDELIKIL